MKLIRVLGNLKSLCSFSNPIENVPQTLTLESISILQKDDNEVEVPCEEDLVEAWVTWDTGESLGLKVSNEKAVIVTLAKVQECQDFVILRRRGRLRKIKDRTKV